MKLAILGIDSEVVELVQRWCAEHGDQVVVVCGASVQRARWESLLPKATWQADWASLLDQDAFDVVLVGRDRDFGDDVEPLRKLVQQGMPLVLTQPACSSIVALELDMIRRDSRAPLVTHMNGARHPALSRLATIVSAGDESSIGRVEQVVVERGMVDRRTANVQQQLARDAGIARAVVGAITRVNAVAPSGDAAWSNLNVQMIGQRGVLARWSVEPAAGDRTGRITLIGTRGRVTLEMPEQTPWRLRDSTQPESDDEVFDWIEADATRAALVAARQSEVVGPDWPAVCRDLEVADTAELSLRRGRAIDFHHETVTEEDTFKGIMSAVGCLLLMLVPMVLVAGVAIEGFMQGWHQEVTATDGGVSGHSTTKDSGFRSWWLVIVVTPLVAFLLLQLLRLVFPPTKPTRDVGPRATEL